MHANENIGWEAIQEDSQHWPLASTHMFTHTHTHTQTHTNGYVCIYPMHTIKFRYVLSGGVKIISLEILKRLTNSW